MSLEDGEFALCPRCGERQYNVPPGWTERHNFWTCSSCLRERCAQAHAEAVAATALREAS